MDYTKEPLFFKIKKTLRYISLYGISRTLVKIKGQYHMNKSFENLPTTTLPTTDKEPNKHIGILGCGNFGFSNIAYYVRKNYGQVIRGCMDVDANRAASLFQEYKCLYYSTNADDIINDEAIDMVYVVSNHASHAEYAIKALEKGKAVHIEKPHAVNLNQLVRLCNAIKINNGKVRLGFNRPNSKLGNIAKAQLASQQGETMLNWFIAGHAIEAGHWYFSPEEGGRVMGNLCHWTDLSLNMIPREGQFPIRIIPTKAEKSDCDISVSYVFGDGSIATITFSAKGHTFEGVRETLNAHRGNILLELKDFQKLRLDNVEKVANYKLFNRDHGHQYAVKQSYNMLQNSQTAQPIEYIWNTGYLALKTKEALESNETIVIEDFSKSFAMELAKI